VRAKWDLCEEVTRSSWIAAGAVSAGRRKTHHTPSCRQAGRQAAATVVLVGFFGI
jgi:hypothetical protein